MKLIRKNLFFILPYFLFLTAGIFVLLHYPKGAFEIKVNQHQFDFGNYFFYYATSLGNGFFFFGAVILFLFINFRKSILLAVSGIICLGLSPFFKNYLFPNSPRPLEFLKDNYHLKLVDGVEVFHNNSFPSGHTLSAFALFCMLAIIMEKKWFGLICFFLAFSVGFSRVYLAQHFFVDIYFGSIIGVAVSVSVFLLLNKFLLKKNILEKSFLKLK